jgi:hypothetical protein
LESNGFPDINQRDVATGNDKMNKNNLDTSWKPLSYMNKACLRCRHYCTDKIFHVRCYNHCSHIFADLRKTYFYGKNSKNLYDYYYIRNNPLPCFEPMKKARTSYYIKFSLYGLMMCIISTFIWSMIIQAILYAFSNGKMDIPLAVVIIIGLISAIGGFIAASTKYAADRNTKTQAELDEYMIGWDMPRKHREALSDGERHITCLLKRRDTTVINKYERLKRRV